MNSIGSITARAWRIGAVVANGAAAVVLTSVALRAYGVHVHALGTAGGMPPLDPSWWMAAASMQNFPERIAWLAGAWFAAAGAVGVGVLAAMAWRWTLTLVIEEISTITGVFARQAENARAVPDAS